MEHRISRDEYTVGWVCALVDELTVAQMLLDEEHQNTTIHNTDTNVYTLGSIGGHNVVLACLPAGQLGANSAATLTMQMKYTFPAIRFVLMVGVGGGVPGRDADIRLGDVVVSQPANGHSGVVQYDFGKSTPSGFKRTGSLNAPPAVLLAAVTKLQSYQARGRSSLTPHLSRITKQPKFRRGKAGNDVLFEATYNHVGDESCASCVSSKEIKRKRRATNSPEVHYGTIASGNQVMRNGVERDKVSSEIGAVLCFEMEAAGMMNNIPCLVIRGICDYSDSHKNKRWQPYAAATAAAYAKELLLMVPAAELVNTQNVSKPSTDQIPHFYLPFLRNLQFIGRSSELHVLEQKLLIDKDCRKMAIGGLGGIGKTQVALQFGYFVKEHYPEFSIFWLQAMGMESFKEGYMGIAQAIGIHQKLGNEEDLMVLVQQRLSAKSAGKWLLIADNVDDLDLLRGQDQMKGLLNLLPESDDGLILFTTRHGAIAQHLAGSDVIDLGNMTERETIDLLERSLIRKGDSHGNKDMMDLLVELEFLPLAVKQVAAYVNTNRSSIPEYLSLLRNTPEEAIAIVNTDFSDKTRYPNLASGVAKTWTITFNKVLQLDPIAADLLKFMSCIAWRAIPLSILPTTPSGVQLARAIGLLCSFSLIERRDHGTKLDMHRLVHLATRLWVAKSGRQGETTMAAFKQLSEVFPSHYYTDRETWREYMPHVAYLERYSLNHDSAERAELCMRVGKCLLVDERVKEATVWLRQSCEWREKNLSPRHTQRLTSQRYLAMAYRQSGQLKESIELLEYVVAMTVTVLTEDDPDRLVSQYQLAVSYQANGQTEESIKLLENIVCIQTHLLPDNDDRRLGSQHMLAMAYQANGRVQASIELLEHITGAEAKILAEDDPKRLSSQHTLAMAYSENSQIEEAIKLLTHVCTIKAKSFAESHPNRLVSEYALAMAYKDNSQIAKSIKLLRHITTIEAKFLAEDDPYRLMSVNELASCYELLPKQSGTEQSTVSFVGRYPADQRGRPGLSRESWGSEVTWNAGATSATGFDQAPEHQELGLRSTPRVLLCRPMESILGKRKK